MKTNQILFAMLALCMIACSRDLVVNRAEDMSVVQPDAWVVADAATIDLREIPDQSELRNGLCGDMFVFADVELQIARLPDQFNNRYELTFEDPDGRSSVWIQTYQGRGLVGGGPNGVNPCQTKESFVVRIDDWEFPLLGYITSCKGTCRTLRATTPPP